MEAFKREVSEKWDTRWDQIRGNGTTWKMMSEVLTEAAKETCEKK